MENRTFIVLINIMVIVAQLVEHQTVDLVVAGSSPVGHPVLNLKLRSVDMSSLNA